MERKSKSKIGLIDKSPPIFTTGGCHGFLGVFPPTQKDVILQYFGYHNYLLRVTNRQSAPHEAVKLVVKDIISWWEKTGIDLKHLRVIQWQVKMLKDFYQLRRKAMNKVTAIEVEKRKVFIESLEDTFWVVAPDYENKLKISQVKGLKDPRLCEDWKYLEGVRGKSRTAWLGSFDTKTETKRKRSISDHLRIKGRVISESAITSHSVEPNDASRGSDSLISSSSSDSSDSGKSGYAPITVSPKKRQKRLDGIPNVVLMVSEKAQVSIRNVRLVMSTLLQSQ